jgi:hypothetical protein
MHFVHIHQLGQIEYNFPSYQYDSWNKIWRINNLEPNLLYKNKLVVR